MISSVLLKCHARLSLLYRQKIDLVLFSGLKDTKTDETAEHTESKCRLRLLSGYISGHSACHGELFCHYRTVTVCVSFEEVFLNEPWLFCHL